MTNSTPIGYKESTLGPIPQDWVIVKLGDLGETFSGLSGKRKHDFGSGKKYIPYMNIFKGSIIDNNYLDLVLISKGERQNKVCDGDILFTTSSETPHEVGMCSCYKGSDDNEIYLNSFSFGYRLTEKQRNQPLYLTYFFRSELGRKIMYKLAQGATRYNLSKVNFMKTNLPLPPLPEQKAIASILSSCDETITGTQKLIEKLELRHKTLCQQLLTGKKRVEGFDGKWKEEKIEKYITYTPREIVKPKEDYLALGVRSHAKGIFQKPDTSTNENAMDVLFEVKKDDLVMSITFAWEHAVAIAREKDDGGLVSHRFPTYIFKEGKATSKFFKYFIKQPRFKYQLGVISPGGAGRNRVMSKKDFIKLRITIPNLEEQIAISKILDESEKEINHTKQKISNLKKIKKGLMQQLLTGKTRVPKAYLTN